MSNEELIELRSAAARLFYNSSHKSEDYKMIIRFIEKIYDEKNNKPTEKT